MDIATILILHFVAGLLICLTCLGMAMHSVFKESKSRIVAAGMPSWYPRTR